MWEMSFSLAAECFFQLEATSSIQKFQSPGYPDNYPVQTRCQWQIRAPKDKAILLTFPFFYVQDSCSSDYVFIFDSLSIDTSHAITQWVDISQNEFCSQIWKHNSLFGALQTPLLVYFEFRIIVLIWWSPNWLSRICRWISDKITCCLTEHRKG